MNIVICFPLLDCCTACARERKIKDLEINVGRYTRLVYRYLVRYEVVERIEESSLPFLRVLYLFG